MLECRLRASGSVDANSGFTCFVKACGHVHILPFKFVAGLAMGTQLVDLL